MTHCCSGKRTQALHIIAISLKIRWGLQEDTFQMTVEDGKLRLQHRKIDMKHLDQSQPNRCRIGLSKLLGQFHTNILHKDQADLNCKSCHLQSPVYGG
jgi:hypothetical protein